MQAIYKRWRCHYIASGERYIAALGNGITFLERKTLAVRHHFSGIRYIHSGLFVDDLTFMVFTGEQKLHFLDLQSMEIAWSPPRPKYLASSGDMRCCLIPGTKTVACIARGRRSLAEHYLLYYDYEDRTVTSYPIPDCYCVVDSIVWDPLCGITFLCSQAKGDNVNCLAKIMGMTDSGQFSTLWQGEKPGSIRLYSGKYFFFTDNSQDSPERYAYPLAHSSDGTTIEPLSPFRVELPLFTVEALLSESRTILPFLAGVDNEKEMLTVHCKDWLGIYDLHRQELRSEYTIAGPWCACIADQTLLIGCDAGLYAEEFHTGS